MLWSEYKSYSTANHWFKRRNWIEFVLNNSVKAGIKYVFGAVLRLRDDIWQRMRTILKSLDLKVGIYEIPENLYNSQIRWRQGYNFKVQIPGSRMKWCTICKRRFCKEECSIVSQIIMKTKAIERRFHRAVIKMLIHSGSHSWNICNNTPIRNPGALLV